MNKHDPLNRKCLQNCVVNRGARVSCAHLHHDCTCPAQKEDPFSDFMKSQGINVVDVTPTQKEECRNDRNLEMIGVISLFQSKVYDTEQLYKEMEEIFKKDCLSQISQAEARGREDTITAFEEWAKKYRIFTSTCGHTGDEEKGYQKGLTAGESLFQADLLKFADSLKKKHETN